MKKILINGLALSLAVAASAQDEAKLPKPPKPPVEKLTDVPPPPPEAPRVSMASPIGKIPAEYSMFLKEKPTVRSLSWNYESVIIRFKSGKEERYTLSDKVSMKEAEAKYGELPAAPPPPPLPPLPPNHPQK
ncbi:MAG: hypothetical protein JWQ96_3292 [Segetibacter sp.]|nr:hypothetical protein [Segetibacter sp.]